MNEIITKREFKPATLNGHLRVIKRLDSAGFAYPRNKNENIAIVKEFLSQYKASVQQTLLNTVIVCRDIADKPNEKMKELRTQIAKEMQLDNVAVMNTVGETLMKKDDFISLLDVSYTEGNWNKYILNYLWLHYGVRNQDVDVVFAKSKAEMADKTKNYLYVKKSKVIYERNKYKTVSVYGRQAHTIADERFITACFNSMTAGNSLFKGKVIGNAVRKYLINGMGEALIFKMLIADAVARADTHEINVLSAYRGTAINTIKASYDVNAVANIIREE